MRGWRMGIVVALLAGAGAAEAAPVDCTKAIGFSTDLPAGVRITGAENVPAAAPGTVRIDAHSPPLAAGLPGYCKVSGTINARKGANGVDHAIGFEIALPAEWNGRLLFQGGGGLNGVIHPPIGARASGDTPALARGFAVVSTDSGHRSGGGGFDRLFMADQQAALDFADASVETTTLAAKQIVAAHYGRPAHHSYIVGCSTGGREAMQASQRFPSLFDGVVSGAPAMRTGLSNIGTSHITAMLNRAAPRDAAGRPTPLFPDADRALVVRAVVDACDGLDGLRDGVIGHVGACRFDPATIACRGGKQADCLSPAQVKGLRDAFTSPKDAAGNEVYPAFPWDSGIGAAGGGIPGILTTGTASPLGPPNLATEIDIEARLRTTRADAVQRMTDTDVWTNLSTFLDRGGRIIWYHGVSDPWFSGWDTLDYFERAGRANGARWADAARLYMVPGAGHCGGGDNTYDQFDLLTPIVEWVEQGKAPADVRAWKQPDAHQSDPRSERPLCPWPSHPHYRGAGDVDLAGSFECRE